MDEFNFESFSRKHALRLSESGSQAKLRCGTSVFMADAQKTINYAQSEYALVYVVKGEGEYRDNDGAFNFSPGSLIQRKPGKEHSITFHKGKHISTFIAVPANAFELFRETRAMPLNMPVVIHAGLNRNIIREYLDLADELREKPEAKLIEWVFKAQIFIYNMMNGKYMESGKSSGGELVEKACQILGNDLDKGSAVPDVAEKLSVSYSKLRRLFKRQMGISMEEYRIRRRIERAGEMLISGNYISKDIAFMLGYPDVQAFHKQFKKISGATPAKFQLKNLHSG